MYAINEGIVFKSVYELKCDIHCASSRKNDCQIHGQNGPHTPTKKGIMFKSTGTQPKNKPCVPVNTSNKESLTNIIAEFLEIVARRLHHMSATYKLHLESTEVLAVITQTNLKLLH